MAESTKTFLVALCGLPASGKSTFARALAVEFDRRDSLKAMVIASDTVRAEMPALSRTFFPEVENAVRRLTLARAREALREGFPVIFDDLNYYRSMRRQLYTMARDLRVPYFAVHLATDETRCIALNNGRGKTVPDEVIITDAVRFDPPGEVPWDEAFFTTDALSATDEVVVGVVADMMEKAHDFIPPLDESGTGPLEKSRREELDSLSRHAMGELFRKHGKSIDPKAVHKKRIALVNEAAEQGLSNEEAEKFFRGRVTKIEFWS